MPTFLRTLAAFRDLVFSGELPLALLNSNVALVWGYLLALAIALPVGIGMGLIRTFRAVVNPYLIILLSTPLIAILPILQAVFGLGLGTRIVVVFVFAFVYITVNTELGVRTVPVELIEMAQSFGATRWRQLTRVTLPHAFPAIMSGARLGLGRGVVGMVIAELFLVSSGLGSMLAFYMARFDAGAVLSVALTMVLEGVVIMSVTRWFERKLARKW
jgi:ABC-type nitrate/sulfonate/bicarbonate transport system permease component